MRNNQVSEDCPLTHKELPVVKWLADGKTYSEIAEIEAISMKAVSSRILTALAAAGASNSVGLVAMALRKGWIE